MYMSSADNKLKKLLSQYRYESETWKRYLQFIQQENNFLKTRLSQVLQQDTDIEFLERAEIFQNKFLSEDETVHLLRQDVHEMEDMLTGSFNEHNTVPIDLLKKRQFHKLKTDFNSFVSDAA
jgi:hypothetical protein